ERTHQQANDSGRRRGPGAPERRCPAGEVGFDHRRSRDAAGHGGGRAVRGVDDLSRPDTRHPNPPARSSISMFQLRIYTLRSPEALQRYATVHWARHLATFETFGVTT